MIDFGRSFPSTKQSKAVDDICVMPPKSTLHDEIEVVPRTPPYRRSVTLGDGPPDASVRTPGEGELKWLLVRF